MRRVLEGAGFEVDEAATGPLALERLHSGWFALGIVDIGLPALDGWTVLRRLREQHPTPVILMATHAGPLDVRRGMRAGAADFLVKPFGADDLAGRVSALVSPA
jgi:DNA-binding response OmpR family regulator